MNYENLKPEVREYFIKEYTNRAETLRAKAANPRARKAAEFTASAIELEEIVRELKK